MIIDVNPTPDEAQALHDYLRAYENMLATYLDSPLGQSDPDYTDLAKNDITLNVQIFNISINELKFAAANAGAAVDAINAAITALNNVVKRQAKVATNLKAVQAALSFVVAIVSKNPATIITAGGALVTALKGV